jgi:ubiquitin C
VDTVWASIDANACAAGRCQCESFEVVIQFLEGNRTTITIRPCWTIEKVKGEAFDKEGTTNRDQRLIFVGKQLKDSPTIASYNIQAGSTMHLVLRLRGGKPVIYLLSPVTLDATVDLKLVPEWSFSALYPVVPVRKNKEQKEHPLVAVCDDAASQFVTWKVQVLPDGTLVDEASGSSVSYLYWEAE